MTAGPRSRASSTGDVARRYEGLMSVLQEGVLVQDAQGKVLEANPAAEFVFAAAPGALIGGDDPVRGAVDEDHRPIPDDETPAALAISTASDQSGRIVGI